VLLTDESDDDGMKWMLLQSELIMDVPRQRKVTSRYGKHDSMLHMSDLDSSNSDEDDLHGRVKKAKRKKRQGGREVEGNIVYTRAECFKVEKNLLVFGLVDDKGFINCVPLIDLAFLALILLVERHEGLGIWPIETFYSYP